MFPWPALHPPPARSGTSPLVNQPAVLPPALSGCEGSTTVSVQPSDISVLLARGQPSESSVLLTRGQLREISVLLPFFVRPLIKQTFKTVFEWPSWSFWETLRSANSPWGLPLWRRWPLHPIGFGPWPQRVKLRPLVGRVYRGPSSFNCFLLLCFLLPAPHEVPITTTTPHRGSPAEGSCRRPSGSLNCRLLAEMPDFD